MEKTKRKLSEKFREVFQKDYQGKFYFAPGRVNLMGEHTDYNGGHVLPCALSMGTYGLLQRRTDRRIRIYSINCAEDGMIEYSLDELSPGEKTGWADYLLGVIWSFVQWGHEISFGMDILVYGNIPMGSGLSSSASLEVLLGFMLRDLGKFDISKVDLALLAQYAENQFNHVHCGIMDQFVSVMGKRDYAILLDTIHLKYEYIPLKPEGVSLILVNSGVRHSLAASAYNERRNECEDALRDLQCELDIQTLGDLTVRKFEQYQRLIQNPVCWKRARHVVYENQRTIAAAEALKENAVEDFGRLMSETQISLRDYFEVSCMEIDILVERAWNIPGVLGARMTGGGFGGCTINLVRNQAINFFFDSITEDYRRKTGKTAEFYIVDIENGVRIL